MSIFTYKASLIDRDWGSRSNYDRDYRIAWGASKPHVRALIGAMRMRGRGMFLKHPLKGGVPKGLWYGATSDGRWFEVDFNGLGRLEVRGSLHAAQISMSGVGKAAEWETMWVREETWKWIVDEIIGKPEVPPKISLIFNGDMLEGALTRSGFRF